MGNSVIMGEDNKNHVRNFDFNKQKWHKDVIINAISWSKWWRKIENRMNLWTKKYVEFSSTSDQNLFVFSMNKMCILETLLDVEISKAICNLFPWLRCFMYIFDGHEFWFFSIYSFFVLFVSIKKGLLLGNNQSWGIVFVLFYTNLEEYPAEIFMKILFTTLFV